MAGGRFDSSLTRVAPCFDALLARDKTGVSWLPELISLPADGSAIERPVAFEPLIETKWGRDERPLFPPVSLLSWLIRNLEKPADLSESEIGTERRDLLAREPSRVEQALKLLRADASARAWHILEGPSYPDAFLASSDSLIVVEGKRTESGPTTSTTWMPVRHQILRHIDAAFEIRGRRSVFGFFIVEGETDGGLPPSWVEACRRTLEPDALERSLPHRPMKERNVISQAFLGATTWQRVCAAIGIPFSVLPTEVKP